MNFLLAERPVLKHFQRFVLGGLLWLTALVAQGQALPPRPQPARLVNDFAGVLSGTERQQLESRLRAYMDTTSTQLVVVIVPTTGDVPPGDYAYQVGRSWGVGQKGQNNGLVLLWATNDRKVFIATGYGMEGSLPDGLVKRIITNQITPAFKQGRWAEGLNAGIDELTRRAGTEYQAEPQEQAAGEVSLTTLLTMVLLLLLLMWLMGRICRNSGGGGLRRRSFGGPVFWPYTTVSGWGSSSGNWGGGGGGGGFDFGGGSFGGGGAGGDY